MNSTEFNIKYKDFLEEGHYGLAINIPEVTELLDDLFKDLTCIPGFKYSQIKSKFGMARFYTNLQSPHLQAIIEERITNYLKPEKIIN